jgi:GTP-binding protein
VGIDQEPFEFYLVDIPGVGFARKDMQTRKGWLGLLQEFTGARSSLSTVFHLVDSRHGLMEADNECFALLETLPPTCQYVVVLTKADKVTCFGI